MTSIIEAAETHGNPHRLLLQIAMARGGIRTSKIVEVFQAICKACSIETETDDECTPETLCDTLIDTINPILEKLDLAVAVSTSFSVSDEKYFVLFSPSAFARPSKMLLFSDTEERLFQTWVKIMFIESAIKDRGELDSMKALNACIEEDIRPLQAQDFLNKLVKDNILQQLNDSHSYVFTPRAIMELEPRLRASAYDIPSCPICSTLVIIRRFSEHCFICNTVIHSSCLYKMITLSTAAVACPGLIDDSLRCTNKYDNETLEGLKFDTSAPEMINRQVEIVGIRGGTQVPESDEEMAEKENGETEEGANEEINNNIEDEAYYDEYQEVYENGYIEVYEDEDGNIYHNASEEYEVYYDAENGETYYEDEQMEEYEEVIVENYEEGYDEENEAPEDYIEGEELGGAVEYYVNGGAAEDDAEEEANDELEEEEQNRNESRAKSRNGDALDELLAEFPDED